MDTALENVNLYLCFFILLFFLLLPWLQWTKFDRVPLPSRPENCRSAVHNGWLYIVTHKHMASADSSPIEVVRTQNLKNWTTLPTPPDTEYCQGILSHNDQLFMLSSPPKSKSADGNQRLIIHELLLVNDRSFKWLQLPNASLAVERQLPAFFGVGNSLLVAGGSGPSMQWPKGCCEYDLVRHDWTKSTNWPALPKQRSELVPVAVDGFVHLFCDDPDGRACEVFSIKVESDKPVGPWLVNHLPPPPFSRFGACHVHGNIVVAGGRDHSDQPQAQSAVLVFSPKCQQWRCLPELAVPRKYLALVCFGDSLFAIGGFDHGSYSDVIEELPLFSALK